MKNWGGDDVCVHYFDYCNGLLMYLPVKTFQVVHFYHVQFILCLLFLNKAAKKGKIQKKVASFHYLLYKTYINCVSWYLE